MLRDALGHLGTIKLVGPEGIELAVDLRNADEGTIARDLSELFLQVGAAAASKGTGVVFLLDEVQFVNETAALVGPARQQHVDYEQAAIDLALSWTGGYPFYIQQLGKHAWNLADGSPITRSDIEHAMPAAQVALDASIYEVRIQRTTDQERRYMRAMAELGAGPYRSGDVATKLGRKTSEVSMIRQRLLDTDSCTRPRTTATSTSRCRATASSWCGTCPDAHPRARARAEGPGAGVGRRG